MIITTNTTTMPNRMVVCVRPRLSCMGTAVPTADLFGAGRIAVYTTAHTPRVARSATGSPPV